MALPVSFLSDFGLDDEFVGVVHGVIARISPESRVIDISHGVPRGDVRAGALTLVRAIQYLPPGVAVAVVDPGVGTDRLPIAARTPWGHLVGPDNGVLAPAVQMTGGADLIVRLENPAARLPGEGATFDGRDVFAPAAALLAAGEIALEDLGPAIPPQSSTPLMLPLAEVEPDRVVGEVLWVDTFGNAQTNVTPPDLRGLGLEEGAPLTVEVGAHAHDVAWVRAYGEVAEGEPIAHVDSYGQVALAVRNGRADETLNVAAGTAVTFRSPQ